MNDYFRHDGNTIGSANLGNLSVNKWPKISIITPSFNQGKFIEETILSVINQEYPNLEYIIIDGKSNDQTLDIIKKYENYISFWVSEKDKGQSDAINKGFRKASGDIIGWLNSDDLFDKITLFEVAKAYISLSNKEQNKFWLVGDCQAFGSIDWKFVAKEFRTAELLQFWDNVIGQPSSFWSKKMIGNPVIDENLFYSMDLDLWLRMSKISKPIAINKTLSYARFYPDTKTASGQYERYLEIRKVINFHNQGEKYHADNYIESNLKESSYTDYFNDTLNTSLIEFRKASSQKWRPSFGHKIKIAKIAIRHLLKYILEK
jgi:glycosyltransferase involved in cell wall biosynthesis